MMRFARKNGFSLLIGVFAPVALVLLVGCEESEQSPISISPSSATLQSGQSWEFAASGGSDYTWSLRYEDTGTLSTRTGPRVRFRSTYAGVGPAVEQVLRVTGTAASGSPASAEVHISQVPVGGAATGGGSSGTPTTPPATPTPSIGSVSGAQVTVLNLWPDGSTETVDLTPGDPTQTFIVTQDDPPPAPPGISRVLAFSNVTWADSVITGFTLVVDGTATLTHP